MSMKMKFLMYVNLFVGVKKMFNYHARLALKNRRPRQRNRTEAVQMVIN